MKPRLALLPLALATSFAASASEELRLAVRETVTQDVPGASAAFAVDADIVEASVQDGRLRLTGRHVGQTLVVHVGPAVPATGGAGAGTSVAASGATGVWENRYDSASDRFGSSLALATRDGERALRLQVQALHRRSDDAWGARTAFPHASLELTAPGRSLVLLDKFVQASPLTLDGVVVRGVHLQNDRWDLHAGVSSATPWEDRIWPRNGDRVLSASRRFGAGDVQWVPSAVWLPDSEGEVPGVLSLGVERGRIDDPFRLRAELGWSGALGGSFDLAFRNEDRQVWLEGSHRPAGFAALDLARPPGTYLDGAWLERLDSATTLDVGVSASKLDFAGRAPQSATARLEVQHRLTGRLALSAGWNAGRYSDDGVDSLRRDTWTAGARFDTTHFGLSALYRYQQLSAADSGGHGGRLSLRASGAGWHGHLFLDAQQQAPTLDLILREGSDLARVFAELGLMATTPEEALRLLRDNAAVLTDHGVEVGELRLDPLHVQGGLELSWQGTGPRRPKVGMRLIASDVRDFDDRRRSRMGTLYGAWRFAGRTELEVGYTAWRTQLGDTSRDRGSFQVALRSHFSDLHLPGSGRAIRGRVVEVDGSADPAAAGRPLADIEVVLDGGRRTRTDANGRYEFKAPGRGEHQVAAILPARAGAFFTVPSQVKRPAGGEADFAISFAAARVSGVVRNDAGVPLAGVSVRLDGPAELTTTTDSSGAYVFHSAEGRGRVSVLADSLPPGYDLTALAPLERPLAPNAPVTADFTVRAQRSLQGTVRSEGADSRSGKPAISILETGRDIAIDAEGRFLVRALPPGRFTLVARTPRGERRQPVVIPAEPGVVKVEVLVP